MCEKIENMTRVYLEADKSLTAGVQVCHLSMFCLSKNASVQICGHKYMCMYMRMYVSACDACLSDGVSVRICVHTYMYMYICACICMYVCNICLFKYLCIPMLSECPSVTQVPTCPQSPQSIMYVCHMHMSTCLSVCLSSVHVCPQPSVCVATLGQPFIRISVGINTHRERER